MRSHIKIFVVVLCFFFMGSFLSASMKTYQFVNEPIDVVIPSTDKDIETLNLCIAGIKSNCSQIRRIIVVSASRMTDQAEWFDEAAFPFKKKEIAINLFCGDTRAAKKFLRSPSRVGWYYQQLNRHYSFIKIYNHMMKDKNICQKNHTNVFC